jgi:hypothetical protein
VKNTATIVDAKMSGAKAESWNDRNPKARLRLTVDIEMPTPSEPQPIREWFDQETRHDRVLKEALWKKSQAVPIIDTIDGDDAATDDGATKKKGKKAAAKEMPWNWQPTADVLDEHCGAEFAAYVETHRKDNQRALRASQEAGLLLLLIGKQVHVTIAPAQKAFAQLLRFEDEPLALEEAAGN